jgi:hypothetical protein
MTDCIKIVLVLVLENWRLGRRVATIHTERRRPVLYQSTMPRATSCAKLFPMLPTPPHLPLLATSDKSRLY